MHPTILWMDQNKVWLSTVLIAMVSGAWAVYQFSLKRREARSNAPGRLTGPEEGQATAGLPQQAFPAGPVGDGTPSTFFETNEGTPAGAREVLASSGLPQESFTAENMYVGTPLHANQHRQSEERLSEKLPLAMKGEVLAAIRAKLVGAAVDWPVRIYEVKEVVSTSLLWEVHARFGDEDWGAWTYFELEQGKYPGLRTVGMRQCAQVTGVVSSIDDYFICLKVSEFTLGRPCR